MCKMSMKLVILIFLIAFIAYFTEVDSQGQCSKIILGCPATHARRRCNGCCKESHCSRGSCYGTRCSCQSCNAGASATSANYRNSCKNKVWRCNRRNNYSCRKCCNRNHCLRGFCVYGACTCSRCPLE